MWIWILKIRILSKTYKEVQIEKRKKGTNTNDYSFSYFSYGNNITGEDDVKTGFKCNSTVKK